MQRRQQAALADPLVRYRNRTNALSGTAAEHAFAGELERYGGLVWRVDAGTNARLNKDIFGFDLLCLTGTDLLMVQVKVTQRDPWPPAPIWRARFLALPKPACCRFLLAWLTPCSEWRVWRLLADGTRLEMDWPPVRGEA